MLGEGAPEFDREYLSELSSCMETISPSLEAVSNGAWLGLISYHDTDGVGNDTWGSCLGTGHCHEYHEQNLTLQAFTSLTVGSAFWHGSHTLLGNIADNRF